MFIYCLENIFFIFFFEGHVFRCAFRGVSGWPCRPRRVHQMIYMRTICGLTGSFMHFRHRKYRQCWCSESPWKATSVERHHVSSALTQQRILFAWPCCLPLIKVCKQLTDMCVRVHACMVTVKGGLRFRYGSLRKALFDQHAWLAQIVESENHKQWRFQPACLAVHLEMKHASLNRVSLMTLSQPLSQLCQHFLYWEECSHKNYVCLFLGQLWINLSRRVYLTLSLHDFHIMIYIILDKFSRVPIKNVKHSIFAVPV